MAITVDLVDRTTRTAIGLLDAMWVRMIKAHENFNDGPTPLFPPFPATIWKRLSLILNWWTNQVPFCLKQWYNKTYKSLRHI